MKRTLILLAAVSAMLVLPWACKKPDAPKDPTVLTLTVENVAIQTATVNLTSEGENPSLVRLLEPVPVEAVLAETGSLEDGEAVRTFLIRNGVAAVLPYSSAAKGLDPSTEYLVGAVSFDSKMEPTDWKIVRFTTLDAGSIVIGGGSGAGSVKQNEL